MIIFKPIDILAMQFKHIVDHSHRYSILYLSKHNKTFSYATMIASVYNYTDNQHRSSYFASRSLY